MSGPGSQQHGDPVYEHKRGKVWVLVGRQEREIRALRYQVKVLQTRLRVPRRSFG